MIDHRFVERTLRTHLAANPAAHQDPPAGDGLQKLNSALQVFGVDGVGQPGQGANEPADRVGVLTTVDNARMVSGITERRLQEVLVVGKEHSALYY